MNSIRERIIAEALSWVGTPYHDHACLKGVGVDCARLLEGVAKGVELIPQDWEAPLYHPNGYLHKADNVMLDTILALGGVQVSAWSAEPGDILLFQMPNTLAYGHAGILLPERRFIHAVERHTVMHHQLTGRWARALGAAVTMPGIQVTTL